MFHILFADRGLLWQPFELRTQHGGLKFTQAMIESDDPVVIFVGKTGAPRVDVALDQFHVFEGIRNDRSAFSRCNQLAGLKAECSQISHRTGAVTFPHCAVRVRAIFDDFQIVLLGDAQDFVHVSEAHAQMNGKNRLRLRSNGLFD
jgi:hypothetical protein